MQLAWGRHTGGSVPSDGRWQPEPSPISTTTKRSSLSAEILIYKLALSAVSARQADSEFWRRSCWSSRRSTMRFSAIELIADSAPAQPWGEAAARRAQSEHLAQLACCAQRGSTFRAQCCAGAWAKIRATCCMQELASRSSRALSRMSLVCARSFVEF